MHVTIETFKSTGIIILLGFICVGIYLANPAEKFNKSKVIIKKDKTTSKQYEPEIIFIITLTIASVLYKLFSYFYIDILDMYNIIYYNFHQLMNLHPNPTSIC